MNEFVWNVSQCFAMTETQKLSNNLSEETSCWLKTLGKYFARTLCQITTVLLMTQTFMNYNYTH